VPGVEITAESVVTRAEQAVSESVLGDTVVLDVATGRYVRLNASAAAVWDAAAEAGPVSRLADVLAERFGLEGERALVDTCSALRELEVRGLVTVA
jgi:hypothetical protein